MLRIKKIIVSILAATLVFNLTAAGAFAQPAKEKKDSGKGKVHVKVKLKDVNGHWAEEYMNAMNMQGIIEGYGDETFQPDNEVKQDEAITMITRLLKLDADSNAVVVPQDIETNVNIAAWAKPYVALALSKGILNGEDMKNLSSNKNAQRYEVAVWLARALGMEGQAAGSTNRTLQYADSLNVPGWAKGYVWVISDQGIMMGYPDKCFKPEKGILRAEISTMLFRVMNRVTGVLDLQPVKGVIQEVYGSDNPSVTLTVYGNRHITYLPVDLIPASVKDVTIPVDDDALIYLNGKKAVITDLAKGCRATVLVQSDGQAAMITAKTSQQEQQANGEVVLGWLTSVQSNSITALTSDGSKTYTLNSDVEIRIDGKEAATGDLKADMMVKLVIDSSGNVKEVNAYRD